MNILNINLNLLRTFWAVYKAGGITAAAKTLDIAPPSVSYSIKVLERQLGVTLFLANNKGVTPTEEATNLFAHVDSAIESLKQGSEELNEKLGAREKVIKLGLPIVATNFILRGFLREFSNRHPEIKLEYHHNPKSDYLTELENQNIDIALMFLTRSPSNKDIRVAKVMELTTTFYASTAFARQNNLSATVTLERLRTLPFIVSTKSGSSITDIERTLGFRLKN